MKILYVSQYFPPEMGAPAARAVELARHWANHGHDITVLTGFPNHPTGIVPPEYRAKLRRLVMRETLDGVKVVRTWLFPSPNRGSAGRMLNYASFCLSSAITGLFLSKPDIVIGTSPQLLVALAAWWIGRARRIPFVFEVRDLWPESLLAVGIGNSNSSLYRGLSKIAGFLYAHSARVVVVTPAFKDYLIKHWQLPPERISIVENGVETDLFSPGEACSTLRKELDADGRLVVAYIGTMGMAHGLETVIEAAAQLQDSLPQILFVFIGEGAEKERIIDLAKARSLNNLRFVDQQPREKIPDYIRLSDICLVLLKKTDLFKTVIPTKMLEFMSCARPLVLGVDGQARKVVEDAQAGIFVEPENVAALISGLARLAAEPDLRTRFGENGRRYILQFLSRAQTAKGYLEILQPLVQQGSKVRTTPPTEPR